MKTSSSKKFVLFVDRDRLYLYPWYFADECLTKDIKKICGKKISQIILEFKKNHIFYYHIPEEIDKIGEILWEKIKKNKEFYKLTSKKIKEFARKLISFCQKVSAKKLSLLSNRDLLNIYLNYRKIIREMRVWGWIPVLIDGENIPFLSNYCLERLSEEIKKKNKDSNIEEKLPEYFSILTTPDKPSEVKQEEIDRLKLLAGIKKKYPKIFKALLDQQISKVLEIIKKNPLLYQQIEAHRKKYEWLPYAYIGPVMSIENVIHLIQESLKSNLSPSKELQKIERYYKNLPQKRKEIIKKYRISKELQYFLDIARYFMWLKDWRKGIYQKSYVLMDPVIEEIAKRLELEVVDVKYLSSSEIRKYLSEGSVPKQQIKKIKQRKIYCVAIIKNGEAKVLEGKEALQFIKKHIKKEKKEEQKELKGMIAFSGKARGTAKIIAVVKDLEKMKEGDILISPATNPDLISAMKKASAIVTDSGGITCHAAIVSRELKIPCIVGTKIATKAIKDGDIVEVDANKGIVKIIKPK